MVSSAGSPSSFPPSSNSGGGKGDVPTRKNPQVLPPWERYLSRNKVTAGRTRGQTQQARPLSVQTRDGARSEAMAAISELQNFSKTSANGGGGVRGGIRDRDGDRARY